MSRTTRRRPHWANSLKENPSDYSRPIARDKWINGRDGIHHDIGIPSNRSPRGYDTWEDTGYPNRRWAKRSAAKIIRRRFKKEIAAILRESGDFSVDYLNV